MIEAALFGTLAHHTDDSLGTPRLIWASHGLLWWTPWALLAVAILFVLVSCLVMGIRALVRWRHTHSRKASGQTGTA